MNTNNSKPGLRGLMLRLPLSIRISLARRWKRVGERRVQWAEWICPEIGEDE